MTRSRSHSNPEPSEHPGAGDTAASLSFWVGNHKAQVVVHRKQLLLGWVSAATEILRGSPLCETVTEMEGG